MTQPMGGWRNSGIYHTFMLGAFALAATGHKEVGMTREASGIQT